MTETTIDITPTWYELLPELLRLTAETHPEPRRHGLSELRRMAYAADRWNAAGPKLVAALELVLSDLNADISAETASAIQAALNTARGQS